MYRTTSHIKSFLCHYNRDERGVTIIEAALIFPIAILLFIGIFETGQALLMNQKVYAASHMPADLLSRKAILNEDDLRDAYFAARLTLAPFPSNTLNLCIAGIRFNSSGGAELVWQRGFRNGGPESSACVNDLLPFAAGLGAPGDGVIVVEARHAYNPTFINVSGGIFSAFDMREVSVLRGRINACIGLNDGGTLLSC